MSESEKQRCCEVAKSLRDSKVDWSFTRHPKPQHWASLRLTHYQHAVMSGVSEGFLTAKNLEPYSCYVLSAPFFHPVPLASMRNVPIASVIAKTVPNRCQVR